jgi:hypothetical protein
MAILAVVSQDSRRGVSLNQLHTSKMLMPREGVDSQIELRRSSNRRLRKMWVMVTTHASGCQNTLLKRQLYLGEEDYLLRCFRRCWDLDRFGRVRVR